MGQRFDLEALEAAVEEAAGHNPIVRVCVNLYRTGQMTREKAMILCVKELAGQVKSLEDFACKLVERKSLPPHNIELPPGSSFPPEK